MFLLSAFGLLAQPQQSYRLIETINIAQKLGFRFPSTFNLSSIAIDEQQGKAFVSSQTSAQFPVLEIDSMRHAGFLAAPFPPMGDDVRMLANAAQKLLYIYSTAPRHDSLRTIIAVNTQTQQVAGTFNYRYTVNDLALERASNRLFVADNSVVRILNGTTLQQEDTVQLGFPIGSVALDSTHGRFFVSSREVYMYQMRIAIFSLTKPYAPLKTLYIPSSIELPKMFIDSAWNRMIIAGTTNARVLQLGTSVVVKHISFGGTFPFAMYSPSAERLLVANEAGYGGAGEGGSYGKLLSIGSVKDLRDSLRLGMRVTGLALDEKRGVLAAVAEQQATVQFFQTATLKPLSEKPSIDLAYSFDDMTVSPDGTIVYITNRYGAKNRLISYAFAEKEMIELPTGTWTTALAVDSLRGRLFGLAQQENTLYLFSTVTNTFLGKVPMFGYKEMRSQALAGLTLDKTRQRLYVSMPEHKTVAGVDLSSAATDKAIKVLGYSFSPQEASNGGLQAVVIPETNKMCVLRTAQKQLNIYNLTNNTLVDSVNLANKWTSQMDAWQDKLLTYDAVGKQVFVGSIAVDADKHRIESHSLVGASRFLGYNPKQTSLFGISKEERAIMLHEFSPQTLAPLASRMLYTTNEVLAPLAHFDSRRNQLLLLDRESGLLRRFDIHTLAAAPISKADTALTTLSIFPNPVVSQATVRFGVRTKEKVKLTVLDSQGREIAVLAENLYEPGTHTITLKVESDAYSTQTYIVHLKSPSMNYSKPIQVQRQ